MRKNYRVNRPAARFFNLSTAGGDARRLWRRGSLGCGLSNEEVAWEVGMSEKHGTDPGKRRKEDCEAREAARTVERQVNLPACKRIPLLPLPGVLLPHPQKMPTFDHP
jgi:hypothetical protein